MNKHTLNILVVLRNPTIFFNYKNITASLLSAGHNVLVLFERQGERWTKGPYLEPLEQFKKEYPAFVYDMSLSRSGYWHLLLWPMRALLTYRRFLSTPGQSTYYRDRYITYLPIILKWLLYIPFISGLIKILITTRAAGKLFSYIESIIPPDKAISSHIKKINPDVIISSVGNLPMRSADVDYIQAAASFGIVTIFPVISWDFLATKGILPRGLDEILVWNVAQQQEARTNHHWPDERMRITGASLFDQWFSGLAPSLTRKAFCSLYGLNPEDPIIVYLGSSKNMAKDETDIVRNIHRALHASSDQRMARVQIVVRPHPVNAKIYQSLNFEHVVMIPRDGSLPDAPTSIQLFYDTLFYSVGAIVGVNTTAVLETICMGKPVIAILTDEYRKTQVETIHFQQLLQAEAMELAHAYEEVPLIIGRVLDGNDLRIRNRQKFIARYIRPCGIEKKASDVVVEEIERIAFQYVAHKKRFL